MNTHVTMTFLKTIVFPDIMEIIPANDNSSLHFHFLDNSSEDSASDRYIASEWTLLVDVGTF